MSCCRPLRQAASSETTALWTWAMCMTGQQLSSLSGWPSSTLQLVLRTKIQQRCACVTHLACVLEESPASHRRGRKLRKTDWQLMQCLDQTTSSHAVSDWCSLWLTQQLIPVTGCCCQLGDAISLASLCTLVASTQLTAHAAVT